MSHLATNRRGRSDYQILEEYEAGIVLTGPETKSAKTGHIKIEGSYGQVLGDEVLLMGAHIAPYPKAGVQTDDPQRSRKLLLHRQEIKQIIGRLAQKGLTLVPLAVYTRHNKVKILLGLGRGKKQFEKRATIKKRETEREIKRALKRKKMGV